MQLNRSMSTNTRSCVTRCEQQGRGGVIGLRMQQGECDRYDTPTLWAWFGVVLFPRKGF